MGVYLSLLPEDNPNIGKKHSEETKRRQSVSLIGHIVSEETRKKLRKANLGKKMSEEAKKKISIKSSSRKHTLDEIIKMKAHSHKGSDNPACRPEVRATMNKDKRKRIRNIETGVIYESTEAAALSVKAYASNIAACARERQKGHITKSHGYHWEYID